MSLQVVTCLGRKPSEPYYLYDQFRKSLDNFGFTELVILGQAPGTFKGLGSKAKLLHQALQDGTVEAERLIFTDSWDVVFAAHPEEIWDRFATQEENARVDLVWNAEKQCFPVLEWADLHKHSPTSYRYLNSGWGIGTKDAFREALDEMEPAKTIVDDHRKPDGSMHHSCDQTAWMKAMLFGHTHMEVDQDCALAQTLHGVTIEELDLTGERIINRETGRDPMVFHFNGGAKTSGVAGPILKKLGLA